MLDYESVGWPPHFPRCQRQEFAPIPGGWFTMGTERGQEDERPPHRVFVDAFELGVFPVTRAEYERFVDATGHEPPRDWSHPPFAQPDLPVVGVSWLDAVAYCAWRSEQDGRPVRLPTEAEWEFAARGRQEALFPWGDVMPAWIPNGGRGPLAGAVAGDARRADRLRSVRHRDQRARMVRRLARQGLLQPIAGAESRGPRPRHAPCVARRRVAPRAHDVPRHAAQQARSVVPVQRLRIPPRAKPLSATRATRNRSSRGPVVVRSTTHITLTARVVFMSARVRGTSMARGGGDARCDQGGREQKACSLGDERASGGSTSMR